MLVEYQNPKKLVVQHKKLINARFDMNINELRIFVYMLLQIKKDDKQFRDIRIPCQLLHGGKKRTHYDEIKAAAHELTGKRLQVEQTTNKGKRKWDSVPLMSQCSYTEGEGYIVASFNPKAAPFLLNLSENFKGVEYERWCNVSSVYSYRLFWLLVQFEDTGYFEVMLDDLKEMLYLDKKYKVYANFKNRVLIPVQEDLKKNNFTFTFKEDKCGTRKVKKLKFYFGMKAKTVKAKDSKRIPSASNSNSQAKINFNQTESSPVQQQDEITRWMMKLGFSIAEIEYYKTHVEAKELKKSVYGLQNKWLDSNKSLLEIHKLSKECLDQLTMMPSTN